MIDVPHIDSRSLGSLLDGKSAVSTTEQMYFDTTRIEDQPGLRLAAAHLISSLGLATSAGDGVKHV